MAEETPLPAQPPLEPLPPQMGNRSRSAAGVPAVGVTLDRIARMGPIRGTKALLDLNQHDGFDCQSCAWPSPDGERHTFEFCENGAKALADEATPKRLTRDFFAAHSIPDLLAQSDHWLNAQGRLTEPMLLRPGAGHYKPISWDAAFDLIAAELRALPTRDGASFYTSGRTSNEAAFLWQLFARAFGTNNLPDCSNMCHESSGFALKESIGVGKGTVSLDDFEHADAIFIVGQNPGTNHPRMLTTLQAAKRRGAKIVSINPLPEVGTERFKNPQDFLNPLKALPTLLGEGTRLADLWLQPRLAGDLALFKGLAKELLERESLHPGSVLDHAFLREHTHGFEGFAADLRATSWDAIVEASGVAHRDIIAAAEIAMNSRATICCWAMGLTQQPHAVETIQQVVNFLLLRGNLGRRGAGACPVRGHSNVQGDRTVGIWERVPPWIDQLDAEFGIKSPRAPGLDTVDTIRAMHEGRVRVFVAMGGNFLSATPDTEYTAAALSRCSLTAHVATKLNRAHLITGRTGLILPCLGRSERDTTPAGDQFVTTEDSMGIINASRGKLDPASPHLRSEPAIICALARALFEPASVPTVGPAVPSRPEFQRANPQGHSERAIPTSPAAAQIPWDAFATNYDLIRDRIAKLVPGFADYNRRIREGIFYLPNPVRDHREWNTKTQKANFVVAPIPRPVVAPGEFVLTTIRSHDQFNTTVYGLDDRYRGIFGGRRVVFMHADDIAAAGLMQGQLVDLTNRAGGVERVAPAFMVAPYTIPRGCVAAYFPEANVLVPIDSVAPKSNTPTSKYVLVTITPSAAV